jgi:hypothetical protein
MPGGALVGKSWVFSVGHCNLVIRDGTNAGARGLRLELVGTVMVGVGEDSSVIRVGLRL